jgi:hypothetical protein
MAYEVFVSCCFFDFEDVTMLHILLTLFHSDISNAMTFCGGFSQIPQQSVVLGGQSCREGGGETVERFKALMKNVNGINCQQECPYLHDSIYFLIIIYMFRCSQYCQIIFFAPLKLNHHDINSITIKLWFKNYHQEISEI